MDVLEVCTLLIQDYSDRGLPSAVAAGKTPECLFLLVSSVVGGRRTPSRGMQATGVANALLQGEVDTGQACFSFNKGGCYVMTDDDPRCIPSAETSLLADSSLVFTAPSPLPAAKRSKRSCRPVDGVARY